CPNCNNSIGHADLPVRVVIYPQKSRLNPTPKPLAQHRPTGIIVLAPSQSNSAWDGIMYVSQLQQSVPVNDGRLPVCVESGLACDQCVSETAQNLARVCKGLRGRMVGQLFVQIYTEPACARMHSSFVEAYREAEIDF